MKQGYIFTNAYCVIDFEKDISKQLLVYAKDYSLFHAVVTVSDELTQKQKRIEIVKRIKALTDAIVKLESDLILMNRKYDIDSILRMRNSGVVVGVEINDDFKLPFYKKLTDLGVGTVILKKEVDFEILDLLMEQKVVIQSYEQFIEYEGYLPYEYQLAEHDDLQKIEEEISKAIELYGIENIYLSGEVFSFELILDLFEHIGVVNGERKRAIGKNLFALYKRLWE